MGPLLLLGISVLLAWPALAEVGTFNNCKQFFYRSQEPTWFPGSNIRKICQRYDNGYYFASLYDTGFRIPYWSAYTLYTSKCSDQPLRRSTWFIEPQVSTQRSLPTAQLKQNQAISIDYEGSTYDRGHLNPNLFQCNKGRDATFTLTNAVPMDPCFNQIRWSRLEVALKEQLTRSCPGTPFLRIPDPRVSVPSHIWTAVCCDNANQNLKFSFAFLAENKEESLLRILPVSELEAFLHDLYNLPPSQAVKLFADNCNADSEKGREVLNAINNAMFKGFRDLVENYYVLLFSDSQRDQLDRSTQVAATSMDVDSDSLQLTSVDFSFGFKNLTAWDSFARTLSSKENTACVLSSVRGISRNQKEADSFLPKVCTLEEQKGKVSSPVSAKGWGCVWQNCDYHSGTKYMWCSTSHSSDWDYCCSGKCAYDRTAEKYQCRSGDRTVTCSPQYSAVAINGEPCRADHPCGLYDESYYWCYTDYKGNWEYCCSPLHHCDKHGYSYTWCYVDNSSSKWEKCVA
uniref:Endonuclease domain-containing 1 protein-like n=1 Tax=Varanus komodoensis TaxID=61221 RepID=A0A8D2LFV7_VARKO